MYRSKCVDIYWACFFFFLLRDKYIKMSNESMAPEWYSRNHYLWETVSLNVYRASTIRGEKSFCGHILSLLSITATLANHGPVELMFVKEGREHFPFNACYVILQLNVSIRFKKCYPPPSLADSCLMIGMHWLVGGSWCWCPNLGENRYGNNYFVALYQ